MSNQEIPADALAIGIDPSTQELNHIQLTRDLESMHHNVNPASGTLILVELLDHELVRRIFLGFGSLATDRLLRDMAKRLDSLLTSKSRLYYVGVGRFAVLTGKTDTELNAFLGYISEAFKNPFDSCRLQVRCEVVMGLVTLQEAVNEAWDALRKATSAAQQSRERQQSCTRYDKEFDERRVCLHRALHEVTDAIRERQFRLVFQPKVNVEWQLTGVEALLRWRHPVYGNISPAEFIPLADDTELMTEITAWVVQEALDALTALQKKSIRTSMAINVSSHNLRNASFAESVGHQLALSDIEPSRLQIECTEYSALGSMQCVKTLNQLKEIGLKIALDDFGSGYSNLSCLQRIPIDILKLDRSLIQCAMQSRHCAGILVGVVQMSKNLQYKITVEGIESASMMESLRLLGIDEYQGYHISKPLELAELTKFKAG